MDKCWLGEISGAAVVWINLGEYCSAENYSNDYWLVVWNMFFYILGIIILTDFHIFQRGRSTTNQIKFIPHLPGEGC